MKKLSFVGLACVGAIVMILVELPTMAIAQPVLTKQGIHQTAAINPGQTQIAFAQTATVQKVSVQKATRKPRSNSPLEIVVGVFAVSLAAVVVLFKQRIGNWTVNQVFKLQKHVDR